MVKALEIQSHVATAVYGKFSGNGRVTFEHTDYTKAIQENRVSDEFLESAFKFCFVRNPYDRLVSYYVHNLRHRPKWPKGFSEFCKYLRENFPSEIGHNQPLGGANPQVRWIQSFDMNFIGRFEKLNEDFEDICSLIGVKKKIQLPHKNAEDHDDYRTFYTDEAKEVVRELYREDFELFGYEMELGL